MSLLDIANRIFHCIRVWDVGLWYIWDNSNLSDRTSRLGNNWERILKSIVRQVRKVYRLYIEELGLRHDRQTFEKGTLMLSVK